MHCVNSVMHKCIMVKVGENEEHRKYVKTRKFYETRGEILRSRGKEKFRKMGECIGIPKIEGK